MKDSREIISEAFFKKEGHSERLRKILPQYSPEDKRTVGRPGFDAISGNNFFSVSDTDEAKKRLISSFGAIVGNNTVKTMASKAIKSFPIIVSENIDPETTVLLKRLMEEQYANYINLLISNQIVDASQYITGDPTLGNTAIQSLDSISGADFSKRQGLATRSADGKLSLDSIAKNDMLYNLLRHESVDYKFNDEFANNLLENALIVPSSKSDLLTNYIIENYENLSETVPVFDLTAEDDDYDDDEDSNIRGRSRGSAIPRYRDGDGDPAPPKFIKPLSDLLGTPDIRQRTDLMSVKSSEIKSTELWADSRKLDQIIDRRVGEILDNNIALKDRFEKATFLLQTYKIAGHEYISYVTKRLGLPMSEAIRRKLLLEFRTVGLSDVGARYNASYLANRTVKIDRHHPAAADAKIPNDAKVGESLFSSDEQINIANNRIVNDVVAQIRRLKFKEVLQGIGAGVGTGAAGFGVAAGIATLTGAVISAPFILAGILPALVGSSLYFVLKMAKIKRENKHKQENRPGNIYGWERVESLIVMLDLQRRSVQKAYEYSTGLRDEAPDTLMSSADLEKQIKAAGRDILGIKSADPSDIYLMNDSDLWDINMNPTFDSLNESTEPYTKNLIVPLGDDPALLAEAYSLIEATMKELKNDEEYQAELFQEAIISTTVPISLKKTYEFDPKKPADIVVAPEFSIRARRAYGSVEYDSREIKDRRYNQPLIMKISFKERYADGTFADNEMTAVIGILGVVTRVPSEEMSEILRSNIEGSTIKGILKGDNSGKSSVTDLFGLIGKKKPNLPQSAELWDNLEKVSKLAVINKLAGRQNNNISNTHIIFSQKEIDDIRNETGSDYLKEKKLTASLMKRYSAFTIMVANDPGERLYIFDDLDAISWQVVPYSAIRSKDSGDQLTSALQKLGRMS